LIYNKLMEPEKP